MLKIQTARGNHMDYICKEANQRQVIVEEIKMAGRDKV